MLTTHRITQSTVAALCDRYLPHTKDMTEVCHAKSVFVAEVWAHGMVVIDQ